MDAQLNSHRHLFLVRLWLETSHSADGQETFDPGMDQQQWRGLVENVVTRRRLYFTSLTEMNDFISFQMNEMDEFWPLPTEIAKKSE